MSTNDNFFIEFPMTPKSNKFVNDLYIKETLIGHLNI